ncbi:MAG: dTMP kinase [Methanosphaera sp. rholeuAM74]|nr:MAG: dTMP kinase [Methanosphaera sp. rholeuAM74]
MYIILEGIDGSGKSTQSQLLCKWLQERGYNASGMVEPTKSSIGALIREKLQLEESTNDTNQQMLTLLFAADRLTLKDELEKVLSSKTDMVVSDRSFYSSVCYQNTDSIRPEWIYEVNKYTLRPDLTIILDLDEEESVSRCDGDEVFEDAKFLHKTRKNYLNLVNDEDIIKIDASGSIEEVQEIIRQVLIEKLGI